MAKQEVKKPKCYRENCFANVWGFCGILSDNEFEDGKCKFFKTKEQYKNEMKKAPEP